MTDKKQTKTERIRELERQLMEAQAQQIHNHHFASVGIEKASMNKWMGSAVFITITAQGGREIVAPVAIRNGLSDATIKAIQEDLLRSYNYATELKPKGATA